MHRRKTLGCIASYYLLRIDPNFLAEPCSQTSGDLKFPFDTHSTGSSKINGAKFSDACSVRANWLCMGWTFRVLRHISGFLKAIEQF